MNPDKFVLAISLMSAAFSATELGYPYDYLDAVICAMSAEEQKPDYCKELEEIVKKLKEQEP